MKSGAKFMGIVVGIASVLAIVVAACVYKDKLVDMVMKVKEKLPCKKAE